MRNMNFLYTVSSVLESAVNEFDEFYSGLLSEEAADVLRATLTGIAAMGRMLESMDAGEVSNTTLRELGQALQINADMIVTALNIRKAFCERSSEAAETA